MPDGGASLVALGIAGASAATKTIGGAVQAHNAKEEIDNYERQDLINPYKGLSVSRLGADIATEEQARATSTGISALQKSGIRGASGSIGDLVSSEMTNIRKIGANLDQQQLELEKMIAADDATIRGMYETREREDLAGLGAMYNAGNQTMWSGIGDITQIGMAAAGLPEEPLSKLDGLFKRKDNNTTDAAPQGGNILDNWDDTLA